MIIKKVNFSQASLYDEINSKMKPNKTENYAISHEAVREKEREKN
jgi:hypothetical protein